MKEFIAEEFSTTTEFSFSVLAVLNYMTVFSVSLEEALLELFQLPSNESVCELCIETESEDRSQASDRFNFLLIQKSIDRGVIDDSFDDCDYKEPSLHNSTDDSEEDVYTFKDIEMVGVDPGVNSRKLDHVKKQGGDKIKPFVFNPFDESTLTTENLPEPVSNEKLNLTMFFNPFSSNEDQSNFTTKANENATSCPHCEHSFTSKYNMKQHIISVHKIVKPGEKVYRCKVKKCSFITGSRVWFERHNCGNKNKEVSTKTSCSFCKEDFANPSSLRRHVKRMHKL